MKQGFSFAAGVSAVVTAFLAGILVSLSLRPPGQSGAHEQTAGAAPRMEIRWRVPSAFNTRLPVIGEMPVLLAEQLSAATAGTLELSIFEPGELVPALAITDAVRQGKVKAGLTWVGYDQGWLPASTLIAAVPFGMEPWEFMAWWYWGGGRELGESLYREQGVAALLCGMVGPEAAGWFRTPIESVADLQGLKIRFAGLGGQVLQNLGASVTLIAAAEIFQALEKGAIDATEFSLPVIDAMLGFDRVARINYYPGWHQPSSTMHLLVNLATWEALDDASRASLEMACNAIVAQGLARSESLQAGAIEQFQQKGIQTLRLTEPVLRALKQTADEVLDNAASEDARFAEILRSQRRFSAEYAIWKRLGYLPRDF